MESYQQEKCPFRHLHMWRGQKGKAHRNLHFSPAPCHFPNQGVLFEVSLQNAFFFQSFSISAQSLFPLAYVPAVMPSAVRASVFPGG